MTDPGTISNFSAVDKSVFFKFKQKITGETAFGGTKNVERAVPLKYLSNFWRTIQMPLINCGINLFLVWSEKCVFSNYTKATTFGITDAKLYVSVVTLLTQDDAKLLQQLKSGFFLKKKN